MQLFNLKGSLAVIVILASFVDCQSQELNGTGLVVRRRGKRYLDFTKGTRMSWRCTVKNNILKVNTLWAYGFGFRANFPFPDKSERRRPFFKRDVFQGITDVLDAHGLDGQACMLKSFCTARLSTDSELGNGMLFKLLKFLFTGTDKDFSFIPANRNILNISTTNALSANGRPEQVLRRGKRYLDFLATSRIFFRVNAKNNIIPKPTIWANGYGFRCNYPIENDKRVRPFRRDTYEVLGDLMDKSGFDGQACMLKAFCAAHADEDIQHRNGMLFKLLKYIFTLNDEDRRHFPYLHHGNCQQILHSHCPLSFNNISPYTDDV